MSEEYDAQIIKKMRNSSVPFVVLLCCFTLLGAFVVFPLASALAWAAMLSFFTYPVYRFIHERLFHARYSYVAAGINTLLILFLLVLPMVGTGIAITREVTRLYWFFAEWFSGGKELPFKELLSAPKLQWLSAMYPEFLRLPLWNDLASNITGVLAAFMTTLSKELLGNAFKLGLNLIVIIMASFFITHDGHLALRFIRDILPLSSASKDVFFLRVRQMLYAIFYGIILTAGIQGLLGGFGWWFVGLANPVFFGSLMFFLAMLPFVGTPIVWAPGVAYLFARGDTRGALMLLFWGLLVVSMIDNILRPLFISEGSKAHILLIFVGILGGIAAWGFLGLFLGPLVLSMAYFLLHIYRLIVKMPDCDPELNLHRAITMEPGMARDEETK